MAIKMPLEAQIQLFKVLFGPHHPVTEQATALVNKGGLINVDLYVVKVYLNGKTYAQTLTVGTSALMKGTVSDMAKNQNMFVLSTFLEGIMGSAAIPSPPLVAPDTHKDEQTLSFKANMAAMLEKVETVVVAQNVADSMGPEKTSVQSIAHAGGLPVCKLRDATKIGQRVHGTSSGSVYRVIAVNSTIRIACSLKGSQMSLRCEWTPGLTNGDKVALGKVFSLKASYGSTHIDLDALPSHRALGALLFSLDGIEFTSMAQGSKQMEVANA